MSFSVSMPICFWSFVTTFNAHQAIYWKYEKKNKIAFWHVVWLSDKENKAAQPKDVSHRIFGLFLYLLYSKW